MFVQGRICGNAKQFILSYFSKHWPFGRPFISNPDLAERLEYDAELAEVNQDKIYGDETGYSDYPTLANANN